MRTRRLIAALLLLSTSLRVHAAEFVRADIYFMPGVVRSFVALPPEALRDAARHGNAGSDVFHVTSAGRIAEILQVLDLSALRPQRADYRADTRLVIDFFDRAGKQTSYRANSGFLCNLKNTMSRRVNGRFRKYFENFTP